MTRATLLAIASVAGVLPAAGSTDLVIPLGYDAAPGGSSFLGPLASSQRVYQLLIHEDQVGALVGADLTGIAFRSTNSATSAWPTADVSFTDYEVHLSGSVAPADRSLVSLSLNVVGTQTQVRDGALLIPAGAYAVGTSPQPFGPTIVFDQPWRYAGGHLLVEIRHTGFTGTSRSVDAIGTSTAGYGTQFSAAWVGTGGPLQGNFAVIRFTAEATTGCYANCDDSTVAPVLNVQDFTCFLQRYAAGESYANCDESTLAPVLNVQDFTCFLQRYAAGCP